MRGGSIKRAPEEELPRGVKRRHLDKVDTYEYSLPDNFENEEIDEGLGGIDVWDEPNVCTPLLPLVHLPLIIPISIYNILEMSYSESSSPSIIHSNLSSPINNRRMNMAQMFRE